MAASKNFHVEYREVQRHWHPGSEMYTGGDALLTMFSKGWEISTTVELEEYWHAGVRRVPIYHFELTRNGETVQMPVISNPYVKRQIEIHADEIEIKPKKSMSKRLQKDT